MRPALRRWTEFGTATSLIVNLILALALSGCGPSEDSDPAISAASETAEVQAIAAGRGAHKLVDPEVEEAALLESLAQARSWTGDLDGMVERRVVRLCMSLALDEQ